MPVCYIECSQEWVERLEQFPPFAQQEIIELQGTTTATPHRVDWLIVGPGMEDLTHLAANISDWKVPPVALFVLPTAEFDQQSTYLHHHPRVGRSIFFCRDTEADFTAGLERIHAFYEEREALAIDNSISGENTVNNISPRWLFQTLMEQLDEYIYFKDVGARFLAVSNYMARSTGKAKPSGVLGLTDYDIYGQVHADEAYADDCAIATGRCPEVNKEEFVEQFNRPSIWVISRKLPLKTPLGYLTGSFGLSRDITVEHELRTKLEANHEKMRSELILARNLQGTMMKQSLPQFLNTEGTLSLDLAVKYIPSFHLSGDLLSVRKTWDGGAAILVADVMGHGVRAAMVTSMIQTAVQQLEDSFSRPAEFMARLNNLIKQTVGSSGELIFATAVYCHFDLKEKTMAYVQAGARHGAFLPAGKEQHIEFFRTEAIRPALGLFDDTEYEAVSVSLASGDRVVLYTDGLFEAVHGAEEFSEERMVDFLRGKGGADLSSSLDSLLDEVRSFAEADTFDDDVCLIALRLP
jgi:sigma-B regulation protein RsbU (phosphoserine phosphatase)